MDINKSLKMLEKDPLATFRCTNCSYPIPSYNSEFGVCPFCELHSKNTDSSLKQNKPLTQILSDLQVQISSEKFDEALKSYDLLFEATKSFGALYSKGVFHAFLADLDFAKRDYETPNGFMEDNSMHAKSALSHFSNAKALFFKTISFIPSSADIGIDALYTKFLCEIKLAKISDAKKSLDLLNANFKDLPMTIYANMLYYSATNQKQIEIFLDKALALGIPNAFYYYSNYLSEKNKLNEAKTILNKLSKRIEMQSSKKLLLGLQRAMTIL